MRETIFIIYVSNQEKSRDFYKEILEIEPVLDVPGMTEFQLTDNCKLGIMPENGIAKILKNKVPHPETGNGIPRCELYLSVDDPGNYYNRLVKAGGKGISKTSLRSWGEYVAYGADIDGHIVAFAKKNSD
ncbi:MAG: VOC family protein [Bacteroidota bacterium]